MGQAMRMMKYDMAGNIVNASSTPLSIAGAKLVFHKLDDGVMGGKSWTNMDAINTINGVLFSGTINTDGGGFTSIRSPLENSIPSDAKGIKIKYKGDKKTYKVLLSVGNGAGGPFAKHPSWQADLTSNGEVEEKILEFSSFKPSFGGRGTQRHEMDSFVFNPSEMTQLGLMLSLKLSNGEANTKFGEGIFDFHLEIHEIDLV